MNKTPKLRFQMFNGAWQSKKLGALIEYKKGYVFKSNEYKSEGVRIIKISDISETSIKNTCITCISEKTAHNYKEWKLKTNDIIISTVGSRPPLYSSMVGKIILIPREYENTLLNQNLVRIRTNNLLNQLYLYTYLKRKEFIDYIEEICRGNANQGSITLEDLLEYKVRYPKLEEQEKISALFSLIDKKIELQKEKIEALKEYKKGIVQKIFLQKIRFKNEIGDNYPAWEEKVLGEYIIEYNEKTTENNQYPVLTSSRKGMVLQTDYFKYSNATTEDNIGYNIIPYGYITFRSRSEDGNFIFNQNKIIKQGIVSPSYPVFTFNDEIDSLYAITYMNNFLSKQIKREIVGTFQLVLSFNKFKKLTIKVPCIAEQKKVSYTLLSIEQKFEKEQEKLTLLNQWKQGLFQQIFI